MRIENRSHSPPEQELGQPQSQAEVCRACGSAALEAFAPGCSVPQYESSEERDMWFRSRATQKANISMREPAVTVETERVLKVKANSVIVEMTASDGTKIVYRVPRKTYAEPELARRA